jgi:hypothetical protein
MILKKTMKDNQTVYVPVTQEEADEARKNGETIIYTDEDQVSDQNDIKEQKQESNHPERDSIEDDVIRNAKRTAFFAKRFAERLKRDWNPHLHKMGAHQSFYFNDDSNDSLTRQLLRVLPFMDEDDIHEVIEKYLSGDPVYANLKLPAIMPFLDEKDCDAVFKKAVESKELGHYLVALAPFVSQAALSRLVDQFIEGAYPDLDIDSLYPFLDSKDIKRAFEYWLKKQPVGS